MQINRLFEIIYLLLEKKSITANELAKKFEVSTRTIYRDIEILSAAQIPIYATKGKNGGISLLEEYVFNKSLLSEEEQNQILFALQSLNKVTNSEEKTILEKMGTIFNKNTSNWIEIDFSHWGTNENTSFPLIKAAILKQKRLEFLYYNSYGEERKRKVEPLQIYFKDKSWYLKAYCLEKQDYRLFKMSRMKEIRVLEENFERELPKTIEKKMAFKTITLELLISNNMSYRVYDEFPKETIIKKENGDFLIHVEYPENDWVYGYLLSFGENLTIVSPKDVADRIKEKLEKSLKNYL